MGYYADTQQHAKINDGYYECRIIADSGGCWTVEYLAESEVDLVQPPLLSVSKTHQPLISKGYVYPLGHVLSSPSIPMHQVKRLQFIESELVVKNILVASRKAKQESAKLNKSHATYCSKIKILIIVLCMPDGPQLWRRLVTGHVKVNAYVMQMAGYPSVLVGLVSQALHMLEYPAE